MVSIQGNAPIPNEGYSIGTGTSNSNVFITHFSHRDPTPEDYNYPIKKRWINLTLVREWVLISFSNVTGQTLANWLELTSGQNQILSLSDNVNTVVYPSSNSATPPDNIQFSGQLNEQGGASPSPFQTIISNPADNLININPMSGTRWIVDQLSTALEPNGTHSTIGAALASSVSGDTILIMPGTYTENLVMKSGVSLTGMSGDSSSANVIVIGKVAYGGVGGCTINNIYMQTNSDYVIQITGSNASILNVNNCFLNGTNHTLINYVCSNASSSLILNNCDGNIGNTGITLFTNTSPGVFFLNYCMLFNSVNSIINSTSSAGTTFILYCNITIPMSNSGTNYTGINHSIIAAGEGGNTNGTAFTFAGNGSNKNTSIYSIFIAKGTGSPIVVTSPATIELMECTINAMNADAISGTGTVIYSPISFDNDTVISASTQTPYPSGPIYNLAPISGTLTSQLMCGNGSPNTVVTAPIGSFFSRTDAASAATRLYVNTDGGTTWTNVTCAA